MTGNAAFGFLVDSAAVATVTLTLTRAKISAPLRRWVDQNGGQWSKDLISCPYCFSHWVAAIVALPTLSLLYAAALVAGAACWMGAIAWGMQQVGGSHD